MRVYKVSTSQGEISVLDTGGTGQPVVCLHANSSCKESFSKQYESALAKKYRFVCFDNSGHGDSDKASDAANTYSVEGHAQVMAEAIKNLNLLNPTIVGHSLGGHVALALIKHINDIAGVVIAGTPPIKMGIEGFAEGFHLNEKLAHLFGKVELTRAEASLFVAGGHLAECDSLLVDAVMKTDGWARHYLVENNVKGVSGDQKTLVETDDTPLCIIHGADDSCIRLDYIKGINFKNAFEGINIIPGVGHWTLWDKASEFNAILERFLGHVCAGPSA